MARKPKRSRSGKAAAGASGSSAAVVPFPLPLERLARKPPAVKPEPKPEPKAARPAAKPQRTEAAKPQTKPQPKPTRAAASPPSRSAAKPASAAARRKLVEFDAETWHALALLGHDTMKSWQELMDEAVTDLLRKHRRPLGLADALRQSARLAPANDSDGGKPKR